MMITTGVTNDGEVVLMVGLPDGGHTTIIMQPTRARYYAEALLNAVEHIEIENSQDEESK